MFAGAAIGVLGFGVWSHHMFTTGLGPVPQVVFSASTMAIGIPTGIKIFNWLGTMYGGSIRFVTATYYSVAFIALFTIGGISGVMHASPVVDGQHQDSYFVVAHIHYVLVGGALVGALAIGLFGLSEVLFMARQTAEEMKILPAPTGVLGFLPSREEARRSVGPVVRGTVMGFLVGLLPGRARAEVVGAGLTKSLSRPLAVRTASISDTANRSPSAISRVRVGSRTGLPFLMPVLMVLKWVLARALFALRA